MRGMAETAGGRRAEGGSVRWGIIRRVVEGPPRPFRRTTHHLRRTRRTIRHFRRAVSEFAIPPDLNHRSFSMGNREPRT